MRQRLLAVALGQSNCRVCGEPAPANVRFVPNGTEPSRLSSRFMSGVDYRLPAADAVRVSPAHRRDGGRHLLSLARYDVVLL